MSRFETSLVARVLDLGADPHDEHDLRIRKRTAVASALALMAVSVSIGVADAALGLLAQAGLAALQVAAFGIALVTYRRSRRLAPLVIAMSAIGLTVLLFSLIPSGGLSWGASNLIWIILVPMAAVLFLGGRAGAPALAGVVIVVILAAVSDPLVAAAPPEPSAARLAFVAVNILGPAAIAMALVIFIDGERVRAKAQSEALLLNVLPRTIADRLKRDATVIADQHEHVTALFADLVDFTPFAARQTAARVVAVLNEIFSGFDALAERLGLEKIKTIGDAYMVVAGAPNARDDHASVILEMAIEMHALVSRIEVEPGRKLQLRTGVASGPAVAGVIGRRKFSYDVWGDAVNLASRMESTGLPSMIQVASSTWLLCNDRYRFTPRDVEVKGIGAVRTYVLDPTTKQTRERQPAGR